MSTYLHYCKECNSMWTSSEDNIQMYCSKCNAKTSPLHITRDEWDAMTNAEKKSCLLNAINPKPASPSPQRTAKAYEEDDYAQSNCSSRRPSYDDDYDDYDYPQRRPSSRQQSTGGRQQSRRDEYDDYEDDYAPRNQHVRRDNYYDNSTPTGDKPSGLSIAAFVLSLLGCTAIIGLILGIVDVTKKDGRKKGLSIAAIIISAIMLLFSCVYLATKDSDDGKKDLVNTTNSSQVTVTNSATDDSPQISSATAAEATGYDIPEQVLLEKDGIKITATGYATDSIWGDGINLLIENNTSKNVMVGCTALIVNDYMISDLFASSVAAGKKANEVLHLSNSQLRQAGIDNVGKIEIYFHASDDDTWESIFDDEYVCLETSDAGNIDTTTNISGQEIYNQNGIRLVAQYVNENDFWGTAILVYAENNSQDNIHVSIDDVSVNDLMVSAVYSSTIYSGKKSFDDITIFSSSLEENNITEINDVEFTFKIYDEDSYTTLVESTPIKLSIQ